MGLFLTSKSRILQVDNEGHWKLCDNEIYMTNSGEILITPRYFWTDGYTIPSIFIPIIGDKNKYDTRPAHAHDLFCRFHQRIRVNLSLAQLKRLGFLHYHPKKEIVVCEDIPKFYLQVLPIEKHDCDNLLKEMMISCKIKNIVCKIIRFGVNFNMNWKKTGKRDINTYDFYHEDIGLVNGL